MDFKKRCNELEIEVKRLKTENETLKKQIDFSTDLVSAAKKAETEFRNEIKAVKQIKKQYQKAISDVNELKDRYSADIAGLLKQMRE